MSLSSSQNAELTSTLNVLSRRVREKIRETAPHIADEKFAALAGDVHDAGDESVASTLEDFHHALLERYLRELKNIDTARARLAEGNIDRCTGCGDEIQYERLRVHPVATRCVRCQALHEKTYRGETTPKL